MTPTPAGLMDFKVNITTGVCLLDEGLMDFKLNITRGVCLLNEGLMDFKLNSLREIIYWTNTIGDPDSRGVNGF